MFGKSKDKPTQYAIEGKLGAKHWKKFKRTGKEKDAIKAKFHYDRQKGIEMEMKANKTQITNIEHSFNGNFTSSKNKNVSTRVKTSIKSNKKSK